MLGILHIMKLCRGCEMRTLSGLILGDIPILTANLSFVTMPQNMLILTVKL